MTKNDLIRDLINLDDLNLDPVVICKDTSGGWDNIERIEKAGSSIAIIFGGGSPFTDER